MRLSDSALQTTSCMAYNGGHMHHLFMACIHTYCYFPYYSMLTLVSETLQFPKLSIEE